ncbi:MAG: anthranilate synthase component I [Firmicutes bacterium]|nr:anthranilate synthase component I [Bacillota bacterium]
MYNLSFEEFVNLQGKGNLIPLYKEIIADTETPITAYLKLKEESSYLLESVEHGEFGRYSFLGLKCHALVSCKDQQLIIRDSQGNITETYRTDNPLLSLKEILADYKVVETSGLPPFYGGAVGYLGYNCIKYFEEVPQQATDDQKMPEMMFMISDTVLVFDHLYHSIKIVSNIKVDRGKEDYQEAVNKIEDISKKLNMTKLYETDKGLDINRKIEKNFKSNISKGDYIDSVYRAKEYIEEGDIFQVVLSQRFEIPVKVSSFSIYRQLRRINPSPYMYYFDFAEFQIVGSSPELLVRVKEGKIENRPIAGTRKRGCDSAEDERLSLDLLADEKERAEHIMLVDLGRNDIGKVSRYGSVKAARLMDVEYYSHVMHMVSDLQGELKEGEDIYSALEACFPAGTVSGAPKIRAMEIIDQLEKTNRGPYAGTIAYFGYSGNLDSCIAIRTMAIKEGKAFIQAGGGIVADSNPEAEYQETINKAQALIKAIELAEGGCRILS